LFGALPNAKKAHISVSNGYGHQECIKLLYEHCAGVKIWLNPQYYMQYYMLLRLVSKKKKKKTSWPAEQG
jgi:hypothetical protein